MKQTTAQGRDSVSNYSNNNKNLIAVKKTLLTLRKNESQYSFNFKNKKFSNFVKTKR